MFNLGAGEVFVILLLALIVLGPQRLPDAAKQLGRFMGEIRRLSNGFQQELRSALDEETEAAARRRGAAATGATGSGSDAAAPEATAPDAPDAAAPEATTVPLVPAEESPDPHRRPDAPAAPPGSGAAPRRPRRTEPLRAPTSKPT